jgi:hypothetical protein
MSTGTRIIREPFIEARCEPLQDGGWRVTSARGCTEHRAAGDPHLALDLHIKATP